MALRLKYDFTKATLAECAVIGPAIVYARASEARYHNAAGLLVTAASGAARIGAHNYSGGLWNNRGFLCELASANLFLQSEALGTSPNAATTTTVSAFATAAPDGETTADDLLHTGSAGNIIQPITVTNNTVFAVSAYVRQGTTGAHDWVKMEWRDASDNDNGFEAWFNIATGAVGTAQASGTGTLRASTARIQDLGGWYRITCGGQIVSGQTDGELVLTNTTADAVDTAEETNSVAWWGVQVEEVTIPTSYMPTGAASTTRAGDSMYLENSAGELKSAYGFDGAAVGSIVLVTTVGYVRANANAQTQFGSNGSNLAYTTGAAGAIQTLDGSTTPVLGVTADHADLVIAHQWDNVNAIRSSINGAAVTADTYVGNWNSDNEDQQFAAQGAGAKELNGFLKSVHYYDTQLSDALLIAPFTPTSNGSLPLLGAG